ncbi:MAG: glucose-1-phosphate adenylyltransferase, partial [Angelakisella sp.]
RNPVLPPHYIAEGAKVENTMITEGCEIGGEVDFSILFAGVKVEKGAVVRDSIVMPGSVIKSGASVQYAIIAENVTIEENATVGCRPECIDDKDKWGIAVVAGGVTVGKNATVPPKAMLDHDVHGEVK